MTDARNQISEILKEVFFAGVRAGDKATENDNDWVISTETEIMPTDKIVTLIEEAKAQARAELHDILMGVSLTDGKFIGKNAEEFTKVADMAVLSYRNRVRQALIQAKGGKE